MTNVEYTLRYSKKAKYLQLRVASSMLEVVVPIKKSISEKQIQDFILQKKDWISQMQQRYVAIDKEAIQLPNTISLLANNQTWEIIYIPTHHKRITLHVNSDYQIKLLGDVNNENFCRDLLKTWLKQIAEQYLCQMLISISTEVNLSFNRVSIRNNMTRWGSCTTQKNISLCCRLMFLPNHLVRHVILHELCHTKIMNHGNSFWALLRKLDNNTDIHVKQLKKSISLIPNWVYK